MTLTSNDCYVCLTVNGTPEWPTDYAHADLAIDNLDNEVNGPLESIVHLGGHGYYENVSKMFAERWLNAKRADILEIEVPQFVQSHAPTLLAQLKEQAELEVKEEAEYDRQVRERFRS